MRKGTTKKIKILFNFYNFWKNVPRSPTKKGKIITLSLNAIFMTPVKKSHQNKIKSGIITKARTILWKMITKKNIKIYIYNIALKDKV